MLASIMLEDLYYVISLEKCWSHEAHIPLCSQVDEKQRATVEFGRLLAAMNTLGFSANEQRAIWHVLAGIYHLGIAGVCKGARSMPSSS